MHLIVALDGPVAFSYPNPINQPKPGSQEQLQVLPSHHLRAQDVLNSSQKRNWEEKSFTFPSESSEEGAWILVFWAKWAKNILKLNVERNGWSIGKKNWMKTGFSLVLTKILSAFSIRWKLQIKGIPRLGLELFQGSLVSSWFFFKANNFFLPLVY